MILFFSFSFLSFHFFKNTIAKIKKKKKKKKKLQVLTNILNQGTEFGELAENAIQVIIISY